MNPDLYVRRDAWMQRLDPRIKLQLRSVSGSLRSSCQSRRLCWRCSS